MTIPKIEVWLVALPPLCDRWRLSTLLGVILLVAIPGTLLANGGTLRLANVSMGDYRVSVFTDPTPVRPDSLDVSVLVIQEGVDGVPDGLEVRVRTELLALGGDTPESRTPQIGAGEILRATRAQADDPRYYAAKFGLGAEGRWRITVSLRGVAGEGEASFEVVAREPGILGHPLVLMLLALLPLLGAGWWVMRDAEDADEDAASPATTP